MWMREKDLKCSIALTWLRVYYLLKSSYFAMSDWTKFGGCWIVYRNVTGPPRQRHITRHRHSIARTKSWKLWSASDSAVFLHGVVNLECHTIYAILFLFTNLPMYVMYDINRSLPVIAYFVRLKVITMIKFNFQLQLHNSLVCNLNAM